MNTPNNNEQYRAPVAPSANIESGEKESIREINSIRSNTGGAFLTKLLIGLTALAVASCGRPGPSGEPTVNVKPPALGGPVTAGSLKNKVIAKPKQPTTNTEPGEKNNPDKLKDGQATIEALTPRDDHFRVIGRIGGASKGQKGTVNVLIIKPDGTQMNDTVELTMNEYGAAGRLNISPITVQGAKLYTLDDDGKPTGGAAFTLIAN